MEITPLDIPIRRWGSFATDVIVNLSKTPRGFEAIETWVDPLSRRIHLVTARGTDTAVEVAKYFSQNVFRHHGLPE